MDASKFACILVIIFVIGVIIESLRKIIFLKKELNKRIDCMAYNNMFIEKKHNYQGLPQSQKDCQRQTNDIFN